MRPRERRISDVLFKKRRRPVPARPVEGKTNSTRPVPATYEITFDMMVKGPKVVRHNRTVRQATVMIGTNVRLVTSGDTVDRSTYEALLEAGIISPPQRNLPGTDDDAPADAD